MLAPSAGAALLLKDAVFAKKLPKPRAPFATEAVAASVALARRLGLETGTVVDALGGSPLVSPWQAAKLPRVAGGEFSAQFALSLALKDVRLALQAAGDGRFAVLACLAEEWQQAVDQGFGEQDLTVVTRVIEQ